MEECLRDQLQSREDPKPKHEEDHGEVTVLGRKERRMLQEEKFQNKDVLCRWQEEDTVKGVHRMVKLL